MKTNSDLVQAFNQHVNVIDKLVSKKSVQLNSEPSAHSYSPNRLSRQENALKFYAAQQKLLSQDQPKKREIQTQEEAGQETSNEKGAESRDLNDV